MRIISTVREDNYETCWHCEQPTGYQMQGGQCEGRTLFVPTHSREVIRKPHNKPQYMEIITTLSQVCKRCYMGEPALIEAMVEGRRFTRLDPTSRCSCGRAIRRSDEWPMPELCVRCIPVMRMLDKRQREIREMDRLMKQLRKACRDGDQNRRDA